MYLDKGIDDLFKYFIDQFYKMLGLFESKDINGYKFGIKIESELEQLPHLYPKLRDTYHYKIIMIKVSSIIDELIVLDSEQHQLVKNHAMESMKLLEEIKEDLK